MRVLVSTASKHGSTTEIGLRIGAVLRAGLAGDDVVEVVPAAQVGSVDSFDAVVLGSAVYLGRWLEDARYVAGRIATFKPRPVWLFSSGPIGYPSEPEPESEPEQEPAEVANLVKGTDARGHRTFAGRLDRHRLGFAEKAMVSALRVADADDRDWDLIDTWAAQIAAELCRAPVGRGAQLRPELTYGRGCPAAGPESAISSTKGTETGANGTRADAGASLMGGL